MITPVKELKAWINSFPTVQSASCKLSECFNNSEITLVCYVVFTSEHIDDYKVITRLPINNPTQDIRILTHRAKHVLKEKFKSLTHEERL